MESSDTHSSADSIRRSFASLFEPLAELAFSYGLQPHEVRKAVTQAMVKAAISHARAYEDRESTAARVAVYCGLSKGEAQQYLETEKVDAKLERLGNAVMAVLTKWHTASEFSSVYGLPYELSLLGDSANGFDALVKATDCMYQAPDILDELVSSGCAEKTDAGKLRATNRTYTPPQGRNSSTGRMGEIVKAFNDTWLQNLVRTRKGEPSFFEVDVHTDAPLKASAFARLASTAGTKLTGVVEEIDSMLNHVSADRDPDGIRGGVGVFLYADRRTMTQSNIEELKNFGNRVG